MPERGTPIGELSARYNRAREMVDAYADLLQAAMLHLDRVGVKDTDVREYLDEAECRLAEMKEPTT